MKLKLLLLLFFIFSTSYAQLDIKHLTGNLYVYTTYHDLGGEKPFPANGTYLVTDEGVVLIDSPWNQLQAQPLLDSIQKRHSQKVIMCLATHFHADRTGSLDYLESKGIKTFSSKQTDKFSWKNKEQRAQYTFKNDTVFTVGGYKIQTFYPGRGHSKDNIVVWFEKDQVLHGGCFVKSTHAKDLGNLSDADLHEWPKSIRRTLTKFPNPVFVIPGHEGWESNEGLQHTARLLRDHPRH